MARQWSSSLLAVLLTAVLLAGQSESGGLFETTIRIPFSGAPALCNEQTCQESVGSSAGGGEAVRGWQSHYACVLYSSNGTAGSLARCGTMPVLSVNVSGGSDPNSVQLERPLGRLEIPFQFEDQTPVGSQLSGIYMTLRGNLLSSRAKVAAVYLEMAHELSYVSYFLLGLAPITRWSEGDITCPNCWRQYNVSFSKASDTIALYRPGRVNNFLLVFEDERTASGPSLIVIVDESTLSWSNATAPSICSPAPASGRLLFPLPGSGGGGGGGGGGNNDEETSEYCLSYIDVTVVTRELPHSVTASLLIIILATILGVTCLVLLLLAASWLLWQRHVDAQRRRDDAGSGGDGGERDGASGVPLLLQQRKDVVNFQDIEIYEKIGRGSFGDVFRASWAGTIVALKVLPSAMHFSPDILLEFKKEITLMTTLRHPNIVQFLAANTMPPDVFVILEYMSRGSLNSVLHDESVALSTPLICRMLLDAARGMHYLHSSVPPIIHRDLKSANLLVDDNWRLKVADFGLARIFSKTGETMTMVGSASWTAPELLNHQHATEKVDIYSFAIVVWECLTRQVPHRDLTAFQILIQVSQHGLRPPVPADAPLRLVELMRACWAENPRERPNFAFILRQLLSIISSFESSPADRHLSAEHVDLNVDVDSPLLSPSRSTSSSSSSLRVDETIESPRSL